MGSGTGIGSCCAKSILIITNILFFLIGLAFFAGGIVLKFAHVYIQPYVDILLTSIPDIGAGASLSSTGSSSTGISIDLSTFTSGIAIALICIGLFVMVVAILGMCGACCASKKMLIAYAIILFLLIAVQIAIVVIIVTGVFNTNIKDQLKVLVSTKYGGIDKFDPETLFLNFIMLKFECCGVDDYFDFNQTSNWVSTRTINITTPTVSTVTIQLITPIACCKMDGPFPNGKPLNSTCAYEPDDTTNNWKTGCFSAISTFVTENYKWPVIGAVCGVLAFELILAIIAIAISRTSSKGDIEPY